MIRILEERTFTNGTRYIRAAGLSTDSKPLDCITGSIFYEVNTGLEYEYNEAGETWVEQLGAVITGAVDDWLDNHPEATTTVQDGSITEAKLYSALAEKVNHPVSLVSVEDNLYSMQL